MSEKPGEETDESYSNLVQQTKTELCPDYGLVMTIGSFVLLALWITASSGPLAWDEAVFALTGRNLEIFGYSTPLQNLPNWSPLRAPGLPFLLSVVFRFLPATDFVTRLVSIAGSALFLLVVWKLVGWLAGQRASLIAVSLISITPGFLLTGTLAFGDNMAAFFGLLAVLMGVRYVDNPDGQSRDHLLVLIPLFLALSTTVRYGMPLLVFLPLLTLACFEGISGFRKRNFRRVLKFWSSLGVSAIMVWVLLYRDPFSAGAAAVASRSQSTSSVAYSEGLQELLRTLLPGTVHYGFGGHFWGLTFFSLVILPLLIAVTICLLSFRRRVETLLFLTYAITPMLAYSLSTRLFVVTYGGPLVAMSIALGVVIVFRSGMTDNLQSLSHSRLVRVTFALVFVIATFSSVSSVRSDHSGLEGFRGISQMSELAGIVGGGDCTVRTQRGPQVAWYSGCRTVPASPDSIGVNSSEELGAWLAAETEKLGPSDRVLFVLLENLKNQVEVAWFEDHLGSNVEMVSDGAGRRSVLVIIKGG